MKPARSFDKQFAEVARMIHEARYNAIKSVNAELVKLYWSIGEYISKKVSSSEWGDAVVDRLADYIQTRHPEFKGFTRRGLYRMRQFYDAYRQKQFVSAALTQISWTNHLLILSKAKTKEEREFYLEALDREVRKADESPSVGIILCKSKDNEVVEYALSRNLSPALVAEYKTKPSLKKCFKRNCMNIIYWVSPCRRKKSNVK